MVNDKACYFRLHPDLQKKTLFGFVYYLMPVLPGQESLLLLHDRNIYLMPD